MIDRRRFITISSASAAAALVPASSVNAQIAGNAFVVSGFPPGGIGDLIARPMADKMRGRYATNVLVDSKVGAGGRLAVEFVKRANPDGLTAAMPRRKLQHRNAGVFGFGGDEHKEQ